MNGLNSDMFYHGRYETGLSFVEFAGGPCIIGIIKILNLKEDIGYFDECDLKIIELSCL